MTDIRQFTYVKYLVIAIIVCTIVGFVEHFTSVNMSTKLKATFPLWMSAPEDPKEPYEILYEIMLSRYLSRLNNGTVPNFGAKSLYVKTWSTPLTNISSNHIESHSPKLILLWTTFFGNKNWLLNDSFKYCPVPNCAVISDRNKVEVSDAIIFHARDVNPGDFPSKRRAFQRWVYASLESPWHTPPYSEHFHGLINWTAGYRQDTDITVGYGSLRRREVPLTTSELQSQIDEIVSRKTKLIVARVSNCNTPHSHRLEYINELSQYLPVHFCGACGTSACPRGKEGDDLMKQYKFYLSFENSICRDYVTEKFWLPLGKFNSVPIALGGASALDYSAVAPNISFLHVSGFPSPKVLADFIQLLDAHDDLYRSFFTWHKDWQFHEHDWCSLCSLLNNQTFNYQWYSNLSGWYQQDNCRIADI